MGAMGARARQIKLILALFSLVLAFFRAPLKSRRSLFLIYFRVLTSLDSVKPFGPTGRLGGWLALVLL